MKIFGLADTERDLEEVGKMLKTLKSTKRKKPRKRREIRERKKKKLFDPLDICGTNTITFR